MIYESIGDARAQILGSPPEGLARLAGLEPGRVAAIEAGGDATLAELVAMAEAMGLPADALTEEPIEVDDPAIGALALLDEFVEVSANIRSRVVRAAAAARDLRDLQELMDEDSAWEEYCAWKPLPKPSSRMEPHQRGRHYALRLRKRLGMRTEPIPSMLDFMRQRFPEVAVIFADLGTTRLSGVSLADEVRGPVIVLNTQGKNESPLVRRFSLAHELCHLLVDRPSSSALAQLSGFKTGYARAIEQTANAFAVRMLLPESELRRCFKAASDPLDAASELMEQYGVHYEAIRLYALNECGEQLPIRPNPRQLGGDGIRSVWRSREDPGQAMVEQLGVPPARAGAVATAAAIAYAESAISRGKFAEFLGVSRLAPIERVLSQLGLEPPEWS